jgi:hypothetical protein
MVIVSVTGVTAILSYTGYCKMVSLSWIPLLVPLPFQFAAID